MFLSFFFEELSAVGKATEVRCWAFGEREKKRIDLRKLCLCRDLRLLERGFL